MQKIKTITVREYALLLRDGEQQGIDCSSIPSCAFDWLLSNGHSSNEKQRDLVRVTRYKKTIALKIVNFVGVLETPCGTRIEILPKISNSNDCVDSNYAKKILLKMLQVVFNIPFQQFHQSQLEILRRPLFEILIAQFLQEVSVLIKQGLRRSYQRKTEKSQYLRGKLDASKQIRQRPGQDNVFHISYEKYLSDRPENRLIRSSLMQVLKWTKNYENKKLGDKLVLFLDEIPCSSNYKEDFAEWSGDRHLAHYQSVKAWCKLILSYQTPISLAGDARGISFLFPMEQLFERYVAIKLRQALAPLFSLKEQSSSCSLLMHNDKPLFKLKPDLVISQNKKWICVADTKWKLIDEYASSEDKYGIRQSDLYQMLAYGSKYLEGTGDLYLIYPKHVSFEQELAPFYYTNNLNLFVVPFDIDTDSCSLVEKLIALGTHEIA